MRRNNNLLDQALTATADVAGKRGERGNHPNGTTTFQQSGFGTYIFYGGLDVGGTMNVGPGQYVVAGAMTVEKNATIQDQNSGTDAAKCSSSLDRAGKTFSAYEQSDTNLYPGLITQINSNQLIANMATSGTSRSSHSRRRLVWATRIPSTPSGINPARTT